MPGITINQRIKRARLNAGLTQTELGNKVKCSQGLVYQWELKKTPDLEQMAKLESVLGPIRNRKKDAVNSAQASKLKLKHSSTQDSEEYVPNDSASPVGIWVRESRSKLGLTPAELAERAKVSYQTILFLENGRIKNPQTKTLNKLQKALEQELPAEIVTEVASETSISPNIGNLTDFDPHDTDEWPTGPGVYVLYDISQRPIYVGKGSKISARLADHGTRFWFKPPIVENASYVDVADADLRHQLEQVLIKFLKSNAVINKQSTETF